MSLKGYRPSPAMVVAVIALVVATTGVTWAATSLPRNSVGSAQVRDNSVRSGDIRDRNVRAADIGTNAIQGRHVGDNQIGGNEILESDLGQVPSAVAAVNAERLAGRPASDYINNDQVRPFRVRLAFGEKVEFVSNGPVGIEAQCRENVAPAGNDQLRLLGVTRTEGSLMEGNDDHAGPGLGSDFLTPATLEDQREFAVLTTVNANPDAPAAANNIDNGFVSGPNGEWIGLDMEQVMLGVRIGDSHCLVVGVAALSNP
jgi:hypothetical protein